MKYEERPGHTRCISLWNPHATLVVTGEKKIETRGPHGKIGIRGRVLIHSALTHDWDWMIGMPGGFQQSLANHNYMGVEDLAYGCLLGSVEIVKCVPVEAVRGYIPRKESIFGNYDDGRFAWILANPVRFEYPAKVRGFQGFFWVPDNLIPRG